MTVSPIWASPISRCSCAHPGKTPLYGGIDARTVIGIQNDFVRGFFDKHLRGLENRFPDAEYATYAADVKPHRIDDLRKWWLAANPIDRTVQVVLETSLGDIEIALYPERAPLSAAQFLAHVDGGHYDGASFYRVTRRSRGSSIEVVQGGLLAHAMRADGAGIEAYAEADSALPPIAHERTDRTGIPNERGSIAFGRLEPGTANSEFFFNVQDNPVLDSGYESADRDGEGYATFGRVLRGLRVLERIQRLPSDAPTSIETVQGQILEEPVVIRRAYRVATGGSLRGRRGQELMETTERKSGGLTYTFRMGYGNRGHARPRHSSHRRPRRVQKPV